MATKTKKRSGKKSEIKTLVVDFFNNHNKESFNYKQVAVDLGVTGRSDQYLIADILDDLTRDGYLVELVPGKYQASEITTSAEGTFVRRSNGKNSVIVDGAEVPVFVAERNSKHALNGDRVRVHLCAQRKGFEPEAQVLEIIEKKEQVFIGTLKVSKNYAFLVTDSKFLACDIFIPKAKIKGGESGDKAIVRIVDWNDDDKNPTGEVVDILGRTGENNSEMNAILAEYGLPYVYPKNVEAAADKIDAGITPEVIAAREDMRGVTTFTIDPRDAKDFDDALSLRKLPNGNWEAGVHIADVTHYVRPGSIIDKEAEKRATSVYLVDRTIPMLPEHLCNGICSLRPNEEKLAYSVIFELDNNAEVKNYRIVHTVIESDRRYKYEEVQELLEANGVVDGTGEPAPAETKEHPYQGENALQLITLDRLAKKLRAARFKNGAVKFDREELHFDIDEKGKPISCYYKRSKDANKLVEEFMLLANRTVAESIGKVKKGKKPKTLPYRIHDNPDPQKLETLREFVVKFGYKMKTEGTKGATARSLNKLMADCEGKPENNLIQMVALRAMMKAKYSVHNIGHFGLAFEYYTHFTSPIRRYPDTMVHRLLTKYAQGGRSANEKHYEELCEHCSDMEQIAQNAERDSIKYKMVEFMGDKLGEEFDAHISGITSYGIYATIDENHCEGMIPMRDIADDYYDFDEKNFCLIGRRHHNKYQLGDAIRIKVAQANLEKKQLDFALAGDSAPVRKEKPAASTSSKKTKKSKQKTRNHRRNK